MRLITKDVDCRDLEACHLFVLEKFWNFGKLEFCCTKNEAHIWSKPLILLLDWPPTQPLKASMFLTPIQWYFGHHPSPWHKRINGIWNVVKFAKLKMWRGWFVIEIVDGFCSGGWQIKSIFLNIIWDMINPGWDL